LKHKLDEWMFFVGNVIKLIISCLNLCVQMCVRLRMCVVNMCVFWCVWESMCVCISLFSVFFYVCVFVPVCVSLFLYLQSKMTQVRSKDNSDKNRIFAFDSNNIGTLSLNKYLWISIKSNNLFLLSM
jgi:hypothetical protein